MAAPKTNETVLEMTKVANDAGQVAMNLVNISNFKVVIPGGKTYQISGSAGDKPSVTVVPDSAHEQSVQKDTRENASAASGNTAFPSPRPVAPMAAPTDKKHFAPPSMEDNAGNTVTVVQHGTGSDVHVAKKHNEELGFETPHLIPTLMDQGNVRPGGSPMMETASGPMTQPMHLEHPKMENVIMGQPMVAHPVMEHQPMVHPAMMEHHEDPHMHEHEHEHDSMHIEVNSTLPAPAPAPKPVQLEPEVIKVEFLPEGIAVDTALSKITKKCVHGTTPSPSKGSSSACESDTGAEGGKSEDAVKAETRAKTDPSEKNIVVTTAIGGSESKHYVANVDLKQSSAPEQKMFVAPNIEKAAPGDVTVVPAEKQSAVTIVSLQDLSNAKNATNVNTVKSSSVAQPGEFPVN